jgi:hypothetical protein
VIAFDPAKYGPAVAALLADSRLASLGPGSPVLAVRSQLDAIALPPLCRAGLYLYFDFLDESHRINQDHEEPDGNFWHAIMHRREPDAANSKYWWRRVGKHAVLAQLGDCSHAIGYEYTTPEAFVDFCERVRDTKSKDEELAQRVQLLEWQLLFDWCYRNGP